MMGQARHHPPIRRSAHPPVRGREGRTDRRHHRSPECGQVDAVQPADRPTRGDRRPAAGRDARPQLRRRRLERPPLLAGGHGRARSGSRRCVEPGDSGPGRSRRGRERRAALCGGCGAGRPSRRPGDRAVPPRSRPSGAAGRQQGRPAARGPAPPGLLRAGPGGSVPRIDRIVEMCHEREGEQVEGAVQVAIVGRPNVGKSSLLNRLLGRDRMVVADEPGTTRDSVDTPVDHEGRRLVFIDTAGLRKRSKVQDDVEFYATLRTSRAIERADVCVLVVDALDGLHAQDLRIIGDAWERGAGVIVAVNKWDLIEEKDTNTAVRGERELIAKAPFLRFIPFLYVSAKTGQRVSKLFDLILTVAEERTKRVPTAEVNRVLESLVSRQQPPQPVGESVRLFYASQIGTAPPRFAIIANRPDAIPESYTRYLVNGFREAWAFTGAPVNVKFRRKRQERRR